MAGGKVRRQRILVTYLVLSGNREIVSRLFTVGKWKDRARRGEKCRSVERRREGSR